MDSSSVGRYQYFASGIQYYKFKTVFSILWYFGLVQIHKLHLVIGNLFFYIKLTLTGEFVKRGIRNNGIRNNGISEFQFQAF